MASDRQVAANRRNAAKSTGPRSKRGKEVVSKNAMRHGLSAQQVLVPGESEEEFEALIQKLISEFEPEGEFELQLVERISTCIWRQRRIYRIESEVLRAEFLEAEIVRLRDLSELFTKRATAGSIFKPEFNSDSQMEAYQEVIVKQFEIKVERAQANVSMGSAFAHSNARRDTLSTSSLATKLGSKGPFTRRTMSCCVCRPRGAGKAVWCRTRSMFR